MRALLIAVTLGAVIAGATPAQASTLVLEAPDTVSRAAGTMSVTGSATFDEPGKVQVFTDGTLDDILLLEATPPVQDLVAGYVEVNRQDENLNLTWQVVDIPEFGGVPEFFRYMWDFSLTPPGGEAVLFQVQAKATNIADGSGGPQAQVPAGEVNGSCVQETVITCTRIGDAPVEFDPASDQVTIRVPFSLLVDPDGNPVVVEGTQFATASIFQGVTAISQVVLSLGQAGDPANVPPSPFLLGEHVQLGMTFPGLSDEELAMSATHLVATAPDGTFSVDMDVSFLVPGEYEVFGRPCHDAGCGAIVRDLVTVTD